MQRKGIDISEFQGELDFGALKADGVEFVMIRTGYGRNPSQKDAKLDDYVRAAEAAGIPYGFYHYAYATTPERALAEAEFALSLVENYAPTMPFAYDIEDASLKGLSRERLSEIADVFLSRIADAGHLPMLYASVSWLTSRFTAELLGKYDVWLAQWAKDATWSGDFGMWQYTSSGRPSGANGAVDMDLAYRDYPALIAEMRRADAAGDPSGDASAIDPSDGSDSSDGAAVLGGSAPDGAASAPSTPTTPTAPASPAPASPDVDNAPDAYAREAVSKAVAGGVLRGDDNGDLMLHSPLSRQDFFVLLDRLGLLE